MSGLELQQTREDESEPERSCWICFATEEDNPRAIWVQPCQCRGSTKWVHQSCLYRWIDEKQRGNSRRPVKCQQCQTEYLIVFPQVSRLARALEVVDVMVRRTSPYVAGLLITGSLYWTSMTYGAITVLQLMGHQRGMELMEDADPLFLLVALPTLPLGLILSRLIRWEDAVLRYLRGPHNIMRKIPLVKWIFGGNAEMEANAPVPVMPVAGEPRNASRVFCGAVMLPTIATMVGNVLFRQIANPLHRSLLGGATYIGIKGILKIYLRQKQYLRNRSRRIVDYTEENLRMYMNLRDEYNAEMRQDAGLDDDDDLYSEVGSLTDYEEDGNNAGDFGVYIDVVMYQPERRAEPRDDSSEEDDVLI